MNGQFINRNGYDIHHDHNEGFFRKAIFEFTLDMYEPLTFHRENGELWRCDHHFFTDKGSIPVVLRSIIPSDTYERSYIFHDSFFLHHGAWVARDFVSPFTFRPIRMETANELLAEMMESEGAWKMTVATVYRAVAVFGRFPWNDNKRRIKAGTQFTNDPNLGGYS